MRNATASAYGERPTLVNRGALRTCATTRPEPSAARRRLTVNRTGRSRSGGSPCTPIRPSSLADGTRLNTLPIGGQDVPSIPRHWPLEPAVESRGRRASRLQGTGTRERSPHQPVRRRGRWTESPRHSPGTRRPVMRLLPNAEGGAKLGVGAGLHRGESSRHARRQHNVDVALVVASLGRRHRIKRIRRCGSVGGRARHSERRVVGVRRDNPA